MSEKIKKAIDLPEIVEVLCSDCGKIILRYQKEDTSPLTYCDVQRILSPKYLANIKDNQRIKSPNQLAYLGCDCSKCIGLPVLRDSGNLSFKLVKGSFIEKRRS